MAKKDKAAEAAEAVTVCRYGMRAGGEVNGECFTRLAIQNGMTIIAQAGGVGVVIRVEDAEGSVEATGQTFHVAARRVIEALQAEADPKSRDWDWLFTPRPASAA